MSELEETVRDDEIVDDGAEALPEDDLGHYDGRWVAMRDGKVIAHEADAETLQANPEVLPTDDVFPVGDPPTGFYTVCA
jgi:hypothetical protein